MNGYIFVGSNSVIFMIASLLKRGHLLKGKKQVLYLRVVPFLEKVLLSRVTNRELQKLSLLTKCVEKNFADTPLMT